MAVTDTLSAELKRLSPRQKAALADHLWREAEAKIGPTSAQFRLLGERERAALAQPRKLRPLGDALRRLKR